MRVLVPGIYVHKGSVEPGVTRPIHPAGDGKELCSCAAVASARVISFGAIGEKEVFIGKTKIHP